MASLTRSLSFFLLLTLVPIAVVGAVQPAGPEVPVSDPLFVAAPGSKFVHFAATNGEMALVVWIDGRGAGYGELYATRVTATGHALDPLGIPLGWDHPLAVVWNGEDFAVMVIRGDRLQLIFVTTEGAIRSRLDLDLPATYWRVASWSEAPDARFVIGRGDGGMAMVDGFGRVLRRDITMPGGASHVRLIGGTDGEEFLILHQQQNGTVFANRISRDGDVLASSSFPFAILDPATRLAGNREGFILITPASWGSPHFTVYALDRDGRLQGTPTVVDWPPPPAGSAPRLVRDGERLLLSWSSSPDAHVRSIATVATVQSDGTLTDPKGILYEPAHYASPILVRTSAGLLGIFANDKVLAVQLSEALEPLNYTLLAASAPRQNGSVLAAGDNGFLIGWHEARRGTFVRRFSAAGAPQGDPVLVSDHGTSVAIVSNGAVYAVLNRRQSGIDVRRMSASNGGWMEDSPFTMEFYGESDIASNGTDAMLVWTVPQVPVGRGVNARAIPLTGPLMPSEPVIVHQAQREPGDLSIASSGDEYLVAWSEGMRFCAILCPPDVFDVRAARLRADATRIDPQALLIEGKKRYVGGMSLVWDGSRYLLAWGGTGRVFAARVTRQGAVDGIVDGEGTLIGTGALLTLARYGPRVMLVTVETAGSVPRLTTAYRATVFDQSAPLDVIRSLPRQVIGHFDEQQAVGTFGVASHGDSLLIAYSRLDRGVGGVSRVFIRTLAEAPLRRRAIAR